MTQTKHNRPALGIMMVMIGMLAISVNDMLIKLLSGGYPLHQVVFIRSLIGISFSLIIVQMEGGFRILRTDRPLLHLLRGLLIVIANLTFFAALASLPLADTTAMFFIAPLIITLLSIPMLGEPVGPLRIGAVIVGFIGVIIVTQPWAAGGTRNAAWFVYLMPLIGAVSYALFQLLTRMLGASAKASAMAVYIQATFIAVSVLFWLFAGDGRYVEGVEDESLQFLLRAWIWPDDGDIWLFAIVGLNVAIIGYTMSQAYRLADAATIAPYEYVGLPLAIFWGWMIWSELPQSSVMFGIILILGSGLFVFLRERQKKRNLVAAKQANRRY
ncbi:DMT family transporter [Roseovarius faecimaris]|uniref:DMT family transporter n=1 Tax=Roseovarius faecimaris TaxID=2494550 RepID=A0A6I6IWH5_9RHOB|nr:DMT family transporter [Roseovarius faecimaris]QGX99806.1 DMT family transporter [Roseovarius faecimaris]